MIAHSFLDEAARELLEQEMVASAPEGRPEHGQGLEFHEEPRLFWILPDLIGLAELSRDQPILSLEPAIRRRVLEQTFIDESGDSLPEFCLQAEVDAHVAQLIRVLERVRELALAQGLWPGVAATPIMFG